MCEWPLLTLSEGRGVMCARVVCISCWPSSGDMSAPLPRLYKGAAGGASKRLFDHGSCFVELEAPPPAVAPTSKLSCLSVLWPPRMALSALVCATLLVCILLCLWLWVLLCGLNTQRPVDTLMTDQWSRHPHWLKLVVAVTLASSLDLAAFAGEAAAAGAA